ncbi:longitudinals lacking protein isoform X3 [Musca domestica]|uniref:Longitudinals lacking protein isoform X3 n=2 Tax=Musca domestica TaxID=7370 RepID=A0ABM3VMJ0_MUSDO|nr:longitudinals lacking protein isoform X3 [Musca domestica]
MDDDQQFCLRWNNHQSTLISVFDTLLENETLVDCTLAAEGKFLKAHKVVLSACSPYFATLLQEQYDKHPIFILKDVKYQELRAMMDYMYRGEVNISQDQLAALLKAAESLQIKGLSDNRSGGGASQPKHPEHHRATMPGKLSGGYTLEQTKRARITGAAGPAMDASEMGSREGSSSPSRRRRKVRRRSIENPMTDVHDNSNSSQQPTQSNAPGLGAITAAASALAAAAAGAPSSAAAAAALASTVVPLSATQQQHQSSTSAVTPAATGSTLSSSKKTDNVKGSTQQHQQQQQDAINTDNVQGSAAGSLATGTPAMDTETATDASTADKSNHKQQLQQQQKASASKDTSSVTGSELVIEPKAEYDDEANDETVEDLTLDEEDMGMDDLDHNAGTSQGGEGSSQGYAPWQHDRSQDELLLATQEAQQRDPQDLTHKLEQPHKENTAPNQVHKVNRRKSRPGSISPNSNNNNNNNTTKSQNSIGDVASNTVAAAAALIGGGAAGVNEINRKRLSMSDVSDMLYEFYRANAAAAKVPKQQSQTSVLGAVVSKFCGQTSPTSAETLEPSSIAAIATNGAASETAIKNNFADEKVAGAVLPTMGAASQNPKLKYTLKAGGEADNATTATARVPFITAIPTSVLTVTPNISTSDEPLDIKPIINPTTGLVESTPTTTSDSQTSVIKQVPPANNQAAAIAAALFRDGYHSFQQQIRAQEIMKFQTGKFKALHRTNESTPTKILETFLRQQRNSECDTNSDHNDGDDEDDSRYNGFDDIHLMDQSKSALPQLLQNALSSQNSAPATPGSVDYLSDESQKYMNLAAQAQALRNLEYSLGDFGSTSPNENSGPTGVGADGEPIYECRHCGKKYRWKSTLRRHENVECGGKEPSHQCPYCPYKSKQRGNLGVHVRKHHSNMPQLASRRRSKYSVKCESNVSSANASDDSNSKLIIDCSK